MRPIHPNCSRFAATLLTGWLLVITSETAHADSSSVQEVGIDQRPGAQVPLDLTFVNSQGKHVTLGELVDGRPVILNLVYYRCPMLCNMALDGMVRSLRTLQLEPGKDFTVITVSFDPQETPSLAAAAKDTAMNRYGRDGAEMHWHFLTGDQPEIEQLAESVGFRYRFEESSGQYAHAAAAVVLTPKGKVSRYLLGVEIPARDLRLSLVEASDHHVGGVTDQVLLLCYHYDPTTGKYGLLVQNLLRIGGVGTVLLIGCGVLGMLWVERRKKTQSHKTSPGPSPAAQK